VVPVKLAALALSAALLPVAHDAGPKRYYLALGDSLTYGIQPAKVTAGLPPSGFRTGYVDVFAKRLRTLVPQLRVVNYGCPGESTKTFVAGLCPWLSGGHRRLHDPHKGSQERAALAFLRAHPGQVGPITLSLGGNDASQFSKACGDDLACVKRRAPAGLRQLAARLTGILGRIRAAAPRAEIIVTGVWNSSFEHLAESDALYRALNATIARVAAGARGRFVPLVPIFDPPGGVAKRKARLCALTFLCSAYDPHPTDAGYRAIAAAVRKASGY
jgi:lysophospholipase L1-like esterase